VHSGERLVARFLDVSSLDLGRCHRRPSFLPEFQRFAGISGSRNFHRKYHHAAYAELCSANRALVKGRRWSLSGWGFPAWLVLGNPKEKALSV